MVPKDSLYFRERARMVKTKTTAHKSTGKRPRERLTSNLPRKNLSKENARKNAAKAAMAAQKNLGSPPQNGWSQEAHEIQAWDCGPEGDPSLPEIHRAAHQETPI